MTQPLLSILIPTVVGREINYDYISAKVTGFCDLRNSWATYTGINEGYSVDHFYFGHSINIHEDEQYCTELQFVALKDHKNHTIGEKRELLYKNATGIFSWQIDDDDDISRIAIPLILSAIRSNPEVDCITFEEHIDIDGKIEKSNHSLTYGDWEGEGGKELWDGFNYHRTPFFKSVIKTEIARSVSIPRIRFGEDHQFAQLLKPHLHSEIHIDQQLYKYIHRSTPHNERYGFNK